MKILLLAAVLGWISTWAVRLIVTRLGVLDYPNARSSHKDPMPTLGGLGILLATWASLSIHGLGGLSIPSVWKGLLAASLILAVLACDEIRPMGRVAKLVVQVAAAQAMVFSGVGLSRLALPGVGEVSLGPLGDPVTLIWLVGIQNLYNFMDGIDGLAGLEGWMVALIWSGLILGSAPFLVVISLSVAGAAVGFWIWNAPPGRIFMGDAGGHFLGLTLGSFAVLGDVHGVPFGVSVVLLGAFLFDAVYTIGRRAQRGENVTLAHRFHLYQRLDRLGWSHGQINLAYGAVTLLLGLAGYLWTFAHPGLALRFTLAILVAMAAGSAWVEWKWSRSIGDAEPQQKVEAPG